MVEQMTISEALRMSEDKSSHPSQWVPPLMEALTLNGKVSTTSGTYVHRSLVRIKQLVYTWRLMNQALPCPDPICDGRTSPHEASLAAGRILNPLGGQFDSDYQRVPRHDERYACPRCNEQLQYSVGVFRGPYWERRHTP